MTTGARRVLVTGASRGLGAACVEVFSAAGWEVVASSRAPATQRSPGVDRVVWDVTDDDVSALRGALAGRPLDLLVNNAGAGTPGGSLDSVDVATVLRVCDVNVGGVARPATRSSPPGGSSISPAPRRRKALGSSTWSTASFPGDPGRAPTAVRPRCTARPPR